ncbi:EMP3 protein, partial [Piaya cayana]|nr:EMP3 protein [Piaya cayana]
WWVLPEGGGRNIWFDCTFENSSRAWACSSAGDGPWLWGVQGGLLGALLVSSVAFGLFVWQLLAGPRGGPFLAPGGGQLLAGLLVLGGAGLYAAWGGHPPGGHFGHCFVLAWLCVPLALGSGVTYLHLRKKD